MGSRRPSSTALSDLDGDRSVARGNAVSGTRPQFLDEQSAVRFAHRFSTLSDSARVLILHTISTSRVGHIAVDDLADRLGMSSSTCVTHLQRLAEVGLVRISTAGASRVVSVNESHCSGLPYISEVVTGGLTEPPCCPSEIPADVATRSMTSADLPRVRDIYAEGIATRNATFETELPGLAELAAKWLPGHTWVSEVSMGGSFHLVGWTAISPVSARRCYAGVGEGSVYVTMSAQGRGVGKALLRRQVTEADAAGLWTLQASIFPENTASIALHRSAGYRTLAVRRRIAQLDGIWRDTLLMERRRADD